jgi:hypothetical protein
MGRGVCAHHWTGGDGMDVVDCCIGCEPVLFCGLLACCEEGKECYGLLLLIKGGTELLEVLGTEGRISVDILELGIFPSWQGGQ